MDQIVIAEPTIGGRDAAGAALEVADVIRAKVNGSDRRSQRARIGGKQPEVARVFAVAEVAIARQAQKLPVFAALALPRPLTLKHLLADFAERSGEDFRERLFVNVSEWSVLAERDAAQVHIARGSDVRMDPGQDTQRGGYLPVG